jgi:hypothetical protein
VGTNCQRRAATAVPPIHLSKALSPGDGLGYILPIRHSNYSEAP